MGKKSHAQKISGALGEPHALSTPPATPPAAAAAPAASGDGPKPMRLAPARSASPTRALVAAVLASIALRGRAPALTPLQLLVLRKILTLTDGRDKVVKVVQYGGKALLWLLLTRERAKVHPQTLGAARERVANLASAFSTFRKVIRLGHALEPWSELHELLEAEVKAGGSAALWSKLSGPARAGRALQYANASLSLANDLVDDAICLAKIGVLEKSIAQRYDYTSTLLWFSTILIDLYDNVQTHRDLHRKHAQLLASGDTEAPALAALVEKRRMCVVNSAKLFADLVFCSYDVIAPRNASDGWQIVSGLVSGSLGLYKHWVKASA